MILDTIAEKTRERVKIRKQTVPLEQLRKEAEQLSPDTGFPFERALFSALSYWNDWYNCMLYITNEKMFTLQYYLQRMLGSAEAMRVVAEKTGMAMDSVPLSSMQMAMTVIATGPIILLYPFVQRYFVKGLTIGAVKG